MVQIREAINNGNRGVLRPFFYGMVLIGSNYEAIQVARQDAGGVGDAFSAPDLNVRDRQKK